MNNSKVRKLCSCAAIAAIYVVLTHFAAMLGLSSGVIQVRFSESLCILPIFTSSAIPGLTIGCLVSNLTTGAVLPDIIFGTLATFLGALGTYCFRKTPPIAFVAPVFFNTIIIPFVLKYAYGIKDAYYFLLITVGIGEIISVCVLGFFLYKALKKRKIYFF